MEIKHNQGILSMPLSFCKIQTLLAICSNLGCWTCKPPELKKMLRNILRSWKMLNKRAERKEEEFTAKIMRRFLISMTSVVERVKRLMQVRLRTCSHSWKTKRISQASSISSSTVQDSKSDSTKIQSSQLWFWTECEPFQTKDSLRKYLKKHFNIQKQTLSKETLKFKWRKWTWKVSSKVLFTSTRKTTQLTFSKEDWLSVWEVDSLTRNTNRQRVSRERTEPACGLRILTCHHSEVTLRSYLTILISQRRGTLLKFGLNMNFMSSLRDARESKFLSIQSLLIKL